MANTELASSAYRATQAEGEGGGAAAPDSSVELRGVLGDTSSAIRSSAAWLIDSKERLFWTIQFVGWTSFFIVHLLSGVAWGQSVGDFYDYSIASALSGFLYSSFVMRPTFKAVWDRPPAVTVGVALAVCTIGAITLTALKLYFLINLVPLPTEEINRILARPVLARLWDFQFNAYILLAWMGGYFGVNYYMMMRDQRERTLRALQLADQAQLKMLRYQLNPHFLFNTLNAISTLVLEKETQTANAMLMRLSSFLRYSLDSDPLQTTTIAEELKALDQYLNIEKVRFQDRLRVKIDMEEDLRNVMIPSLLLQPAIENAIKYAIAPRENGGAIEIVARRKSHDLVEIAVCDDGSGIDGEPERIVGAAGGVGLANMRDRLRHIYGERQSFRVENLSPTGFAVIIEIPYKQD